MAGVASAQFSVAAGELHFDGVRFDRETTLASHEALRDRVASVDDGLLAAESDGSLVGLTSPDAASYFEPADRAPGAADYETWREALLRSDPAEDDPAPVVPEPTASLLLAALATMFAAMLLLRRRFDLNSAL